MEYSFYGYEKNTRKYGSPGTNYFDLVLFIFDHGFQLIDLFLLSI